MGFAQDLLDEIEIEETIANQHRDSNNRFIEQDVECELHIAIRQEFAGDLSPECAQALIDSV